MIATSRLRRDALRIFQAGVAAADPYAAVQQHLLVADGKLHIRLADGSFRSGNWPRVRLLAFGKAACKMAKAAATVPVEYLGSPGIAVTNYPNVATLEHIEVLGAGHPLPDAAGFAAAQRVAQQVSAARPGELVLILVSGGGSALLPCPVAPITLAEKVAVTDLLLSCGATINQINCVRKHLSQLKGGGLAKLASPADLHALILSDVLGDDLASIASGPTVPDDATYQDAIVTLQGFGIWEKAPANVREHLEQGRLGNRPETPKPDDPIFDRCGHTLIGGNALSIAAMNGFAQQLGYETLLYSQQLTGEARSVAKQLVADAKRLAKPIALLAGGETTVTLAGTGLGGRNQELALTFALAAERQGLNGNWAFLSGGTDGRDGPTDAAGGWVDAGSLRRIRAAGLDPIALLDNNDSYHALKASDDLLMTGATGTNVADLQILLLNP